MSKKYKYKTVIYLNSVSGFWHGVGVLVFNLVVLIWYALKDMQPNPMITIGVVAATIAAICGFAKMCHHIKTRRKKVKLSTAEKLLL